MDDKLVLLKDIEAVMRQAGASRIIFKPLSNNDNSKQQIYFGSKFDVIPSGETRSAGIGKKGAIFKAPVNFSWISPSGSIELAPNAQLILYPKYPEVRLSGFLRGCSSGPNHLLKPPTIEERELRIDTHRILVIGIRENEVLAYLSSWDDALAEEVNLQISNGVYPTEDAMFFESTVPEKDSCDLLLERLKEIYHMGEIPSQRMDKHGNTIPYKAQNGAGYTLESLFDITPNGRSEPDFLDWELKSHSKGNPVTLMTPEPNSGVYSAGLLEFMTVYGRRKPERFDFTGIHKAGTENTTTKLTLTVKGYCTIKEEILDPDGGLFLIDQKGEAAAGWGFNKLIDHWKRKHAKTCFVNYTKEGDSPPRYKFGPNIRLATGANLKSFMNSIISQAIYYDPGVNMKLKKGKWTPKKRNQFRIKWKDTESLYENVKNIDLSCSK